VKTLIGIAASPGTAVGPVFFLERRVPIVDKRIAADSAREWRRVREALAQVSDSLRTLMEDCERRGNQSAVPIIASNAQFLADPEIQAAIRALIDHQQANAEWAVQRGFESVIDLLAGQEDEYLRARGKDLAELARRVLEALDDRSDRPADVPRSPSVVVADSLSFCDLAALDETLLQGICLAQGNSNDHALILARSTGIPAVIGLGDGVFSISAGEIVRVDGTHGLIHFDRDRNALLRVKEPAPPETAGRRAAASDPWAPAVTLDGVPVQVMANISSLRTARAAFAAGADGVGLLRTEYLFAGSPQVPSEEDQARAYQEICGVFRGKAVTIRLFDAGSDKPVFGLVSPHEQNPALGLRGIRLGLAEPERLLKPQIRALIQAGRTSKLRILLPMVCAASEITAFKNIFAECAQEMSRSSPPAEERIPIGIMIEVPSAAVMADLLAPEADFFSIGTNDLTQYLYAVDRTNSSLANLPGSEEGALLRLIQQVIDATHDHGKIVGLCGEWGQNPDNLALLVGLGIDEVSVNPFFVGAAKTVIGALRCEEMKTLARTAVGRSDLREIRELIRRRLAPA